VQQHIKQLLEADIIRHSQSSWASNIILICVGYHQLNLHTIKDPYSLLRIDEILKRLEGNLFYSVLDMRKGYHQLGIEEEHKPQTAFTMGPLGTSVQGVTSGPGLLRLSKQTFPPHLPAQPDVQMREYTSIEVSLCVCRRRGLSTETSTEIIQEALAPKAKDSGSGHKGERRRWHVLGKSHPVCGRIVRLSDLQHLPHWHPWSALFNTAPFPVQARHLS